MASDAEGRGGSAATAPRTSRRAGGEPAPARRTSRQREEAAAAELALAEQAAAAEQAQSVPKYAPGDQMILKARSGCWNYTFGPAYLYKGPRSIDEIYHMGEPVVLVADYVPVDELRKLELSRIRGFVFEGGSTVDEELYNFLQTENRAAVMGCQYACYFAREGGWVIVDGVQGMVCFNPTDETLEAFQKVRAEGPPKKERMDAVMDMLSDMVEDAVEQREKEKKEGTYDDPHDHHLTPKEAVKATKEAPGLILQLLSGLPIKGAPGAEEAGYQPEEAPAAAAAEGEAPKRQTAAERRAERDAGRGRGATAEPEPAVAPNAPAGN